MQKKLNFIILILYCYYIFWLSDQPKVDAQGLFESADNLQLFVAYFVMGIFTLLTFFFNENTGISIFMQKQVDFLVLILYCVLIYWLSAQNKLPTPNLFEYEDKLQHFFAYAVMGIFTWRALYHLSLPRKMLFLASFTFCSVYGLTDEWHQSFVVGRTSSAMDWLADSIGGLLTTFSFYWYMRKTAKI
jgi:VanZ family protein